MEKNKPDNDVADQRPQVGSGSLLAQARKQQQLSVEEVATKLNLSVAQIKAIELDKSDGLPEPTYVRGYIRSYAKLLGLEPEDILQSYLNPNWEQSSRLDELPRDINVRERQVVRGGKGLQRLLTLVVLAAIAFGIYFFVVGNPFSSDKTSTNTSTNSSSNSSGNEPVQIDSETSQQSAGTSSDSDAAVASENALTLRFSQTSWVDIRDEEDNRLAYKSYSDGEELTVTSETLMSVFIGNASGVTAEYNGEALDISRYQEGVYAKFVLGK